MQLIENIKSENLNSENASNMNDHGLYKDELFNEIKMNYKTIIKFEIVSPFELAIKNNLSFSFNRFACIYSFNSVDIGEPLLTFDNDMVSIKKKKTIV
ncbi:MAG: hypothetical protein Q4Q13_07630, partial [Vagococcus sp.]|nr:hypothetical protein [Vagococcus sp.]